MIFRLLFFIPAFLIVPLRLSAQEKSDSAIIGFKSYIKDFGPVYEADGDKFVSFEFYNKGGKPLMINKIYSPGIIPDTWPHSTVKPGDSATIRFKISPFGQVGFFYKKLVVFTNAENSPSELVVKGKIINGSFKNSFRYNIGPAAFKQSQMNFGYIYKGENVIRYAPVLNKSDKPFVMKFDSLPAYISIRPMHDTLTGNSNSMLEIDFNTSICDDWDFFIHKVRATVFSEDTTRGWLTITANIREDFSRLSDEEKENNPVAFIPVKVFNFDTIRLNQKAKFNFLVRNNGKRDLDIRAVKPTCGCTAAMPDKSVIAPGDSTYIEVEFDSEGATGISKKGVTVITNDPINYKQFLWVTGFVEPANNGDQ